MSKFGRYHVPESPSAIFRLHFHNGSALKEVDHEPRVAVLDQEDLLEQGIRTSEFIPYGRDETALGSCTCQALTEALSNILAQEAWVKALQDAVGQNAAGPRDYSDAVGAERGAIAFYHLVTTQTGNPSTEWEPTDCGSSGLYLHDYALRAGLIKGEQIAHGANSIVSLMQSDGVLIGMPWLNAWMEPPADNILDGDGSRSTLVDQIQQGLAGGHEIYGSAVEKLVLLPTGAVDPYNTIIRIRNSWSPSWGDHGSARLHLSTLVLLGNQVDVRQFA